MKLLGMLIAFLGFSAESYGTELEKYIVGQNPQNAGDHKIQTSRKAKESRNSHHLLRKMKW
jgi:hypothetical protein